MMPRTAVLLLAAFTSLLSSSEALAIPVEEHIKEHGPVSLVQMGVQAKLTVPVPLAVKTVVHKKQRGGGYVDGSPLFNKQQALIQKTQAVNMSKTIVSITLLVFLVASTAAVGALMMGRKSQPELPYSRIPDEMDVKQSMPDARTGSSVMRKVSSQPPAAAQKPGMATAQKPGVLSGLKQLFGVRKEEDAQSMSSAGSKPRTSKKVSTTFQAARPREVSFGEGSSSGNFSFRRSPVPDVFKTGSSASSPAPTIASKFVPAPAPAPPAAAPVAAAASPVPAASESAAAASIFASAEARASSPAMSASSLRSTQPDTTAYMEVPKSAAAAAPRVRPSVSYGQVPQTQPDFGTAFQSMFSSMPQAGAPVRRKSTTAGTPRSASQTLAGQAAPKPTPAPFSREAHSVERPKVPVSAPNLYEKPSSSSGGRSPRTSQVLGSAIGAPYSAAAGRGGSPGGGWRGLVQKTSGLTPPRSPVQRPASPKGSPARQ